MIVYLTAVVKSKPGKSELLKSLLFELVSHSIKENACLQYELHQSSDDENVFIFHEEWASTEGLALHNSQPHLKAFVEKSAGILDGGFNIYKTNKIS
ncbi:lipoprotein [Flavobacterium noncentrifugens]|uniref:Quinol monooxygenase YgiN n=1 Tax=Flavobacterium noncentrifugens TaxID=1128970 RepID=A0A1G8TC29_9FLAO|nr:putative quinol monooxygenase [Flavobacterium noncentrifugens]GEP50164.1 lipoprotein [Flavobacterium noncentrifugens]SDJ38954.1 Quinol monooxygenase YgiN [Flavobacterium noncentrifugens]